MPLKILYFSCHTILEHDDLLMLTSAGHRVFSLGDFSDPNQLNVSNPEWRRPLFRFFDIEFWNAFESSKCNLSAKLVTREFCKMFDVVIVNNYAEWITDNLDAFGSLPIILRTIGQSRISDEQQYKSLGNRIYVVRYSEYESGILEFAKTDAVIYFGKQLPERCGWMGDGNAVTFHNSATARDGFACPNLGMWRRFASEVSCDLFGRWNDDIPESKGFVPPDGMDWAYNSAAFYFYIYTCPTSYTLSLIEALSLGVPILAPSASLVGAVVSRTYDDAWTPARYEVPRFLEEGAGLLYNSIEDAVAYGKRLKFDRPFAEATSRAAWAAAHKFFDARRISSQWEDFLGAVCGNRASRGPQAEIAVSRAEAAAVEYPPDEVISTAPHQEDVLLWRAFRGKRTGFYIDIGAGDPNYGSVTQWFYRMGWRGVNLEPHGVMFAILQQWRPEDVNLSFGISDQTGLHWFYQIVADAAGHGWSLSSFDPASAARARGEGYVVQEIPTETITLQDVADRYCRGTEIDVLRVSVEGHESEVIRSAQWSRFRPKIVCVRAIDSLSNGSIASPWDHILINANYDCALFDGINYYYVRRESPDILSQFRYPVLSNDRWRLATPDDFVAPWLAADETPVTPQAAPQENDIPSIRNTLSETAVKPALDEILNQINWWQKWEIVPGVFTPGINDVAFLLDHVRLPASLQGARVLDIGGWNGAFSFECERRGASEVVMVEPSPVAGTGFDRTAAFLDSKVKYYQGSIYDLDPKWLGHFDIVLCFGIIYHLRYPLLGLDNIRRICRGELFVESATLESACWDGSHLVALGEIGPELENLPFLQFFEGSQFFDDTTNWFVPNAVATKAMIEAAGFEVLEHHVEGRYFAHARVKRGLPPMFAASHEGADYDLHARHLLGATSRWAAMD